MAIRKRCPFCDSMVGLRQRDKRFYGHAKYINRGRTRITCEGSGLTVLHAEAIHKDRQNRPDLWEGI